MYAVFYRWKQENARKFLDADEYELLEDFEKNLEKKKMQ